MSDEVRYYIKLNGAMYILPTETEMNSPVEHHFYIIPMQSNNNGSFTSTCGIWLDENGQIIDTPEDATDG